MLFDAIQQWIEFAHKRLRVSPFLGEHIDILFRPLKPAPAIFPSDV